MCTKITHFPRAIDCVQESQSKQPSISMCHSSNECASEGIGAWAAEIYYFSFQLAATSPAGHGSVMYGAPPSRDAAPGRGSGGTYLIPDDFYWRTRKAILLWTARAIGRPDRLSGSRMVHGGRGWVNRL